MFALLVISIGERPGSRAVQWREVGVVAAIGGGSWSAGASPGVCRSGAVALGVGQSARAGTAVALFLQACVYFLLEPGCVPVVAPDFCSVATQLALAREGLLLYLISLAQRC